MPLLGPGIRRWLRILALIAAFGARSSVAVEQDFKALVQQAFELHQKGDFSAALPLLHRAYVLEPGDYFVNLLLGIDSLRTGQLEDAVPFLRKASHLRPREEYPLDYLGEDYARQNLNGEAAETYIKALDVARGSAESSVAFVDFALTRFASMSEQLRSSRTGLAAEYRLRALALNDNDTSRQSLLERAADLDPAEPGIWSDLAFAAIATGDLAGAESYCQKALETDPNDQEAAIAAAQLAAQRSNWKQAIARLNSVAEHSPRLLSQAVGQWPSQLQPPSSSAVAGHAAKFFACVRYAKNACDPSPAFTAVSSDPAVLYREQRWESLTKLAAPQHNRTESWFMRGVAFAKLDECQQAIPALERGLSQSTPEVYGMFLLSWCYSREAGRTAEKVRQASGDDAPLHLMRGDILLRLQAKASSAILEYQLALAQGPGDPAVLERLAEAQYGVGKIDEAREKARAALQIDPQRLAAKRTLAKIAMQERDYATALPYLRELAARDPQDESMRIELAKACAQTGALDEAWQELAPALKEGYPDEKGSLHYLLGTVLKKMGRTAEADQAFATATQLSESFQQKSYRDQDSDAQP